MKHSFQALVLGWIVIGSMLACMRTEPHQFTEEQATQTPGGQLAAATPTATPASTPAPQSASSVDLRGETDVASDSAADADDLQANGQEAKTGQAIQSEEKRDAAEKKSGANDSETAPDSQLIKDDNHPLLHGLNIREKYFPLVLNTGEAHKYSAIEGKVSYVDEEQRTASGQKFDPDELYAANTHWPMGTIAKCTNALNDKSVTVVIIDRGPYVHGRILDLSAAAGRKIGLVRKGVVECRVEVLAYPQKKGN